MGYNVLASSQSKGDVERILKYYLKINPRLAKEFLNELRAHLSIHKSPKKIQIRYSDIRIAFLKRFPVGIHFKIVGNTIYILSILGTSGDPKKWDDLG